MSNEEWAADPRTVQLRKDLAFMEASRDSFRAGFRRELDARNGVERIGLNEDGTLDEIVAHGLAHVEQMDRGEWFVEVGGLAFFFHSRSAIRAQPRDAETWADVVDHMDPKRTGEA